MRPAVPETAYRISRLPGGPTVATAAMPWMTSVSVGFHVGVGSRYETAPLNGAAHFIEHMLFKGTRRRSALAISQAVEGIGGYLNAFTSEESTCFFSRARHDHFADLLEVLTDMLRHSRFDPDDLRKEREVIKEEAAMYYDDPQQYVHELLNATQWPGQPLGRPITGTGETLDGLDRGRLLRFLGSHYRAANTVICAAGKITHRQAVRAVKQMVRGLPDGPPPAYEAAQCRATAPVVNRQLRDTEQTHLALGIRTTSRHDESRFALRLLNVILGENMSSRLFQIVREKLGLAYSIHSSVSFFHDTGDLVIAAGVDHGQVPAWLKVVRRELDRLARTPCTRQELQRARDYLTGQIDLAGENTEAQMMNLGEQWVGWGRFLPPEMVKNQLRRLTAADLQRAARRYFRPERFSLALIGPARDTTALRRLLL